MGSQETTASASRTSPEGDTFRGMRYQDLVVVYNQVAAADDACNREYALSDRASATVSFVVHDQAPPVNLIVRLDARTPANPYGGLTPGAMTPAELAKLAEIRAMIDQWKAGTMDTLPASTSDRVRNALKKHGCTDSPPIYGED